MTRRMVLMTVLAVIVLLLPARPAEAFGGDRLEVFRLTNQERADHGVRPLAWGGWIARIAQRHAARMAAANTLYHNPTLFTEVSNWSRVAENVGEAPDLLTVQAAFVQSEHHLENILDPRLRRAGVGVVTTENRVWVCVVFKRRDR